MIQKSAPRKGLFITGTDTGVGKTYLGAQIVSSLHHSGIKAVPRKPIESGCERIADKLQPRDALCYYRAANNKFPLTEICPYRFEPAISPQRAARLINQPVLLNQVTRACIKNTLDNDYLVVEGAGGFYSPLCEDGKNSDLADQLSLPILLIANDRLGCINHILLTAAAINQHRLSLRAVILNRQEQHKCDAMDNFDDLQKILHAPLYSMAFNETLAPGSNKTRSILTTILQE